MKGNTIYLEQYHRDYGYIENILVSEIYGKIADTIWTCPTYHGRPYQRKIWPVVIIIAHRQYLRGLDNCNANEDRGPIGLWNQMKI